MLYVYSKPCNMYTNPCDTLSSSPLLPSGLHLTLYTVYPVHCVRCLLYTLCILYTLYAVCTQRDEARAGKLMFARYTMRPEKGDLYYECDMEVRGREEGREDRGGGERKRRGQEGGAFVESRFLRR